jgi:N-methylhydantoinase A/oxoprolinase/acetone carboxylase beta subunit
MSASRIRIGIDVGGTFTHGVAIDNDTLEVVVYAVTPTTHSAAEGVALGILNVFKILKEKLPPDARVVFLSHSTTQATNALLEGDVATVGILGIGQGLEAVKAKSDMNLGPIELAPGKLLHSQLEFVNARGSDAAAEEALLAGLKKLQSNGCTSIVAAEAFSVDDASGELRVAELAGGLGLASCGTHEMSGLYGLRVRTRTAVLNASILPKMIETAVMTDKSLKAIGGASDTPLMIMRSDGGVMSLDEVRKRPVLTLLSGPAAGIAGALMFLRASDAVYLDVGGTSTDICLIKDGRAAIKSASLGGNPTYLKTLDSRTLGIAGGSMLGLKGASGSKAMDVGPRSAHLAGLHYASFAVEEISKQPLRVVERSPLPGDPPYLVIENAAGEHVAVTPTCASNLLGYVPAGNHASGNKEALEAVFAVLAQHYNSTPEKVARDLLETAIAKIIPTVKQLLEEYGMKDRAVRLIGGGGGAAAIVPFLAEKMGLPFELAPKAEVISAIGAALAMVKETIERNMLNPTQEELSALRSEAEKAVAKMGADPATIEVTIEVDPQKKTVRATATGTVEFVARDPLAQTASDDERLAALREVSPKDNEHKLLGHSDFLYLYESSRQEKYLFNLLKRQKRTLWVTDGRGSVKLQVPNASWQQSKGGEAMNTLAGVLSRNTQYGDAGAQIPALHIVAGRKVVDLTALQQPEQVTTLAREELAGLSSDEPVFFVIHPHV